MINFITILFRYLNFLVLILLAKYVFSRRIVPLVHRMMNDLVAYFQRLQQDTYDVHESVVKLEDRIEHQKIFFDQMHHKFSIWRKKSKDLADKKQQEQEQYCHAIEERSKTRLHYIHNDRALQKHLPAVLESVKVQLHNKFIAQENGKKYIDDLLRQMKDIS